MRSRLVYIGLVGSSALVAAAAGAGSPLFIVYQREWNFANWLLTLAFAVYAFTLIITLLVCGKLSDHVGRRPVLVAALVTMLVATALFGFAKNIEWIIVARAVQGVATGAATSTFTAAIVEAAPRGGKRLATLLASSAPVAGLALGAFFAGTAVEYVHPTSPAIFGTLGGLSIVALTVVGWADETSARVAGAVKSLTPRMAVPGPARRAFAVGVPLVAASWMLSGLFLGLAPTVDHLTYRIDSDIVNGAVVASQPSAAAIAGLLFGKVVPRRATLAGCSLLAAGATAAGAAVVASEFWLLCAAAVVGGIGFGCGFSSVVRTVTPLADSSERGGLFAAIFLVSYLSYGLPTLVAGILVDQIGITPTIVGYATITAVLALTTLVVAARRPDTTKSAGQPDSMSQA